MLPWSLLYLLSARDQQVTWLDPVVDGLRLSASAPSINPSDYVVPAGRVLVLSHVAMDTQPGAGQNVVFMRILLREPNFSGFDVHLKRNDVALGANVIGSLDWQGFIVVPPTWRIHTLAQFNAGAAVNSVGRSIAGVLIPAGNFQR